MAKLDPAEILKNGGQYGRKKRDVRAMLFEHGLVEAQGGRHLVYRHPYHPEAGQFLLSYGNSADIEPGSTYDAAKFCLRIQELAAASPATGDAGGEALPVWLSNALPSEFTQKIEANNTLRVTHGSPARSYTVQNQDGALRVQSAEFSDDPDYAFTFRLSEGARNPEQNFRMQFSNLDEVVAALVAEGHTPAKTVTARNIERAPAKGRRV